MNLSEAIDFTFTHRYTWIHGAGAKAARINSNHALRILGDIDVTEIRTKHFTLLSHVLMEEGKANGTINRVCAALSTILNELNLNGIEVHIPRYKHMKESRGRREFYSESEIKQILEEAKKVDDFMLLHDSILFAYKTGCRRGELIKLQIENIDFENNLITFLDTKNGEDHFLPIHKNLVDVLERRIHYAIDNNVFPWDKASTMVYAFTKIRDSLGISNTKVWHTIRHTTATDLVSKGINLRVVMSVLNHKNINTTLRYAKAHDKAVAEAIDII